MFDLISLIKTVGYAGLFGIIFAESGLLIGFFLPGDSLIFTAGFLASQKFLNIWLLMPLLFVGAVLGDNVGYAFGKKVGPMIFKREDSLIFHKDNLERARIFYEKYGGKAIILARFMPAIRTFAPILAGVGRMKYKLFFFYNIIGGFLWSVGLSWAGYFFGNTVPNVDKYLLPVIALIIFISVLPVFIGILRHAENRERIINAVKKFLKRRE